MEFIVFNLNFLLFLKVYVEAAIAEKISQPKVIEAPELYDFESAMLKSEIGQN